MQLHCRTVDLEVEILALKYQMQDKPEFYVFCHRL